MKKPGKIFSILLLLLVATPYSGILSGQEQNSKSENIPITIVVLGSSTASCMGPSVIDSCWVTRYSKYLNQKNSSNRLINLAIPGFTTYDIMPDDFEPPEERPMPYEDYNITAALQYCPTAIIICLPGNDIRYGYTIEEQVSNYQALAAIAETDSVRLWVTTTLPALMSEEIRYYLRVMRDKTYDLFGDRAIDFWTGLAYEDGKPIESYIVKDRIHFNDAAHKIFFERVVADSIPWKVEPRACPVFAEGLADRNTGNDILIGPNPFSDAIYVKIKEFLSHSFITIISMDARVMYQTEFQNDHINISTDSWPSGPYYLQITTDKKQFVRLIVKAD